MQHVLRRKDFGPAFLLILSLSLNATPQILTLEECVARATTATSIVLKARNNEDAAASDFMKGYLNFLPDLKASTNFTYENGNKFFAQTTPSVLNTVNYGLSYQISSTLNLFNGLADFASLKAAIERREGARLTLKRAQQLVALDVAQSFLQVVLDKKVVAIAQSALNASISQEQLIAAQVKVGSGKAADLASQEAQTSTNASLLLSAQNQVRTDLLLLLQKLRLDVNAEYELQEPHLPNVAIIDARDSDEHALLRDALKNRADFDGARRAAQAADWDVTLAQSGFWPILDANLSLFSNGRTLITQSSGNTNYVPATQDPLFAQLGAHNYFNITLNLTWNIFDRWTSPRNISRASVVARNARIDVTDLERQIQVDVKRAIFDYQSGAKVLESTIAGEDAAQKAYGLVKGRFDAGLANFTEVQVAQSTLVAAQSAKAQAAVGLELKKRSLDTAVGR